MPITSSNLKFYESAHSAGGVDSLGGAITTTTDVDNALNAFFDEVNGDQSADSDTNHRVGFVQNKNSTLTGTRCKVYFTQNHSINISMGVNEVMVMPLSSSPTKRLRCQA